MENPSNTTKQLRTGWASWLAKASMAALLFEAVSGLAVTFSPFHPAIQWSVIVHTVIGAVTLLPLAWYCWQHLLDYRRYAFSHIVLLGYVGLLALLICSLSGVVVTWQGLLDIRTSGFWRKTHLISTFATLGAILPHVFFSFLRVWQGGQPQAVFGYAAQTFGATVVGILLVVGLAQFYSGTRYVNEFPKDYSYLYGTNRPFAPSLAKTDSGGAFDARSLAGSVTCGTAGCHEQIVREWKPSAHRYAAMDTVFQGIQEVMAKQNGPESTRYCGGCHDPISLFSGAKNIFAENLTGLHGYQEGVSCLSCHAIRETDVKGNANFTMTQPREYLWQWQEDGAGKVARDFLIRAYPEEHNKLSKRMFKKPEYCAACHKQFIDQEVNRVGWVQLQNQYDNWAASHWNHKGDPKKTLECRECHMPLVDSTDPAAGDVSDYNRTPGDGKHRSHRFLASNQLMPLALKLEGWEEQVKLTESWLQGKYEVPEIREKWAEGAIVKVALNVPENVAPGEPIPLRVVMASNKVGHDFPTGPLDIIQSWLEVRVTDEAGQLIYSSGKRDEKNFIEPGTFLFKAEPVDQHGNLIDRHNLWEMVGVRYRRSLFPGYSDTVQYSIPCTVSLAQGPGVPPTDKWQGDQKVEVPAPAQAGQYTINVSLQYRKVDQFLLNFLFGETNKLTSPVTEIARATATVHVKPKAQTAAPAARQVALESASGR
ncbi:MAG: multiheme c-type cytochrome [Verrucomicrobiota bacterium]